MECIIHHLLVFEPGLGAVFADGAGNESVHGFHRGNVVVPLLIPLVKRIACMSGSRRDIDQRVTLEGHGIYGGAGCGPITAGIGGFLPEVGLGPVKGILFGRLDDGKSNSNHVTGGNVFEYQII